MLNRLVRFLDNILNNHVSKIKFLNRLLTIICLFFLFRLTQNIDFRFQFEVEYIAASLLIIVGYLFQSISWSLILKNKFESTIVISWFVSVIGKYIPFKIGVPLLRVSEDVENSEVQSHKYFVSFLKEFLFQILSGVMFSTIYILAKLSEVNVFMIFGIYLILILFFSIYLKSNLFLINFFNTISYLFFLLAIVFIGSLMFGEINFDLGIAYIVSSVISLIFVGSPAGIGIREYLFIFLFQSNLIYFEINYLQFLVSIRIIFIFSDFISSVLGRLFKTINS